MHAGRGDAQKSAKFSEQKPIPDMQMQDAFCSKCNAWKGELGLEPTFELYIKHLIQIFDEVKRVLKSTGTCWVVMGDTYAGNGNKNDIRTPEQMQKNSTLNCQNKNQCYKADRFPKMTIQTNIPEKSLCKIPQRFELSMIDHGWIERSDIIWYKPNCMPSSAKDRFTVDYEHVFFFVKSPRYYFETQYEQLQDLQSHFRKAKSFRYRHKRYALGREDERFAFPERNQRSWENVTAHGRIKRCVWKIPTAPYKEAHFATFPPALVEPMIKAGCPEFICRKCGKARETIKEFTGNRIKQGFGVPNKKWQDDPVGLSKTSGLILKSVKEYEVKGLSDCGCTAGFDSGVVLDPFCGSGTVGLVAAKLARNFVGIEINADYVEMAKKRLAPYLLQSRLL